jgi:hypothetical protein
MRNQHRIRSSLFIFKKASKSSLWNGGWYIYHMLSPYTRGSLVYIHLADFFSSIHSCNKIKLSNKNKSALYPMVMLLRRRKEYHNSNIPEVTGEYIASQNLWCFGRARGALAVSSHIPICGSNFSSLRRNWVVVYRCRERTFRRDWRRSISFVSRATCLWHCYAFPLHSVPPPSERKGLATC